MAAPVYEGAEGLSVHNEAFRVIFQIFHIGDRVDSGQNQSAICRTALCSPDSTFTSVTTIRPLEEPLPETYKLWLPTAT